MYVNWNISGDLMNNPLDGSSPVDPFFAFILTLKARIIFLISLLSDEKMSEIQYRGNHDFDALENQKERTRYFRQFSAEMYLHNISNQYSDLMSEDEYKQFLEQ